MSDDHLSIWHQLEKTNPEHVKAFQRPGGFRGHAIKAIYSERRMTEMFGPCGIGWGTNEPNFRLVEAAEEVAVYCTVTVWYHHDGKDGQVVGVGGDMVRKRTKNGFVVDDEAFKKAFTDALTNALKHLGMSADVHMGLYDDNKYVASLRREQQNGHSDALPHGHYPLDDMPPGPLEQDGDGLDGYMLLGTDGSSLGAYTDPLDWFDAYEQRIQTMRDQQSLRRLAKANQKTRQRIVHEHEDNNDVLDRNDQLAQLVTERNQALRKDGHDRQER